MICDVLFEILLGEYVFHDFNICFFFVRLRMSWCLIGIIFLTWLIFVFFTLLTCPVHFHNLTPHKEGKQLCPVGQNFIWCQPAFGVVVFLLSFCGVLWCLGLGRKNGGG